MWSFGLDLTIDPHEGLAWQALSTQTWCSASTPVPAELQPRTDSCPLLHSCLLGLTCRDTSLHSASVLFHPSPFPPPSSPIPCSIKWLETLDQSSWVVRFSPASCQCHTSSDRPLPNASCGGKRNARELALSFSFASCLQEDCSK